MEPPPSIDIEKACAHLSTDTYLTPVSRKSYAERLRRASRLPGFFESPSTAVEAGYENRATALSVLRVLKYLHDYNPHFSFGSDFSMYRLLKDQVQEEVASRYDERERRDTDVDWDLILGIEPHVRDMDLLLYKFVTQMPPRRNKDYTKIRIVAEDDGNGNVYDTSTQQIKYRWFKTGARIGEQEVDVSAEVAAMIPTQQTYVFEGAPGKPVTEDALSKRFRRMFAFAGLSQVATTTLRRSYASKQVQQGLTPRQLAEAALELSHSSRTHMHYAFRQ